MGELSFWVTKSRDGRAEGRTRLSLMSLKVFSNQNDSVILKIEGGYS